MQPHDTSDVFDVKICPKCNKTKPATDEYFHRNKNNSSGFLSECKVCSAEYNRKYRAANKERIAKRQHAYNMNNRERQAERTRAWNEANKERLVECRRAWVAANKEKMTEYLRAYYESHREQRLSFYQDNREKFIEQARLYRAANPEKVAEADRKYHKANPDKIRAKIHLRRTRKQNAEGSHTAADIKRQYEAQKGKCYYCKCKVGKAYHVDHVVPLSRGGSNGPENLVIACPTCNTSKGAKLPHEWTQGNRLL